MSEAEKQNPSSGTVYTVPHPKAFVPGKSWVFLHESADAKARTGPGFVQLLADEEKGTGFLTDLFNTMSQARTDNAPRYPQRENFIAVINAISPEATDNRVSQQSYFHAHMVSGSYRDPFLTGVIQTRSYGQGEGGNLDLAIRDHKTTFDIRSNPETKARYDSFDTASFRAEQLNPDGKNIEDGEAFQRSMGELANAGFVLAEAEHYKSARNLDDYTEDQERDGLVESFSPKAGYKLAPYHRLLIVNKHTLESAAQDPETMASLRRVLLNAVTDPAARTGARIVIDTFNNSDRASDPDDFSWLDDTGLVIHVLGDFEEELVESAKGSAQRRWFEIPEAKQEDIDKLLTGRERIQPRNQGMQP